MGTSNNTVSTNMDMDQFMNEFLEGKYLEEEPKRRGSGGRSKVVEDPFRPSKPSSEQVDDKKRPGVRRTMTSEDAPSSMFRKNGLGVRRTKSGGRTQRSSNSRPPRIRSSCNDGDKLPPQMVLRMMEMYADIEDSEKANAYLHYGDEERMSRRNSGESTGARSPRNSKVSKDASPPSMILIEESLATLALPQAA